MQSRGWIRGASARYRENVVLPIRTLSGRAPSRLAPSSEAGSSSTPQSPLGRSFWVSPVSPTSCGIRAAPSPPSPPSVAAVGVTVASGADFTASSANPANTFSTGTLTMQQLQGRAAILTASGMRPAPRPGGHRRHREHRLAQRRLHADPRHAGQHRRDQPALRQAQRRRRRLRHFDGSTAPTCGDATTSTSTPARSPRWAAATVRARHLRRRREAPLRVPRRARRSGRQRLPGRHLHGPVHLDRRVGTSATAPEDHCIIARRLGTRASRAAARGGHSARRSAWSSPACSGCQRYVIVSGSMTGTYDAARSSSTRSSRSTSLKVGDVITYRPPAGVRPRRLVTHRIRRSPRPQTAAGLPHQGRRQRGRRPLDVHAGRAKQARVRAGVPYVGFVLAALVRPPLRMLVIGLPALLIALIEPRRPVARDRHRGRRSPRVKRAAARACRRGADRARPRSGSARRAPTFVAAGSNPRATFATAADFNTVAVRSPTGHAAARARSPCTPPPRRTAASRA